VGIMGLKTPDRQKSMIGLILSAVGFLVSLVVACLVLIYFINGGGSSGYYY